MRSTLFAVKMDSRPFVPSPVFCVLDEDKGDGPAIPKRSVEQQRSALSSSDGFPSRQAQEFS